MTGLKRSEDYEQSLGEGRFRIFEGHPRYCQQRDRHEPHRFEYRYLRPSGEEWSGDYWCDGHPTEFARRPDDSGAVIPAVHADGKSEQVGPDLS